MFKDYYVGRKGLYHNKNVVILSTNYDEYTYQDFGFKFDDFEIEIFYEDGTKKILSLKGNQIKNIVLYEEKNKK